MALNRVDDISSLCVDANKFDLILSVSAANFSQGEHLFSGVESVFPHSMVSLHSHPSITVYNVALQLNVILHSFWTHTHAPCFYIVDIHPLQVEGQDLVRLLNRLSFDDDLTSISAFVSELSKELLGP